MVLVLDLEDLVVVDSDPAPGQDLPAAQDPAVVVLILLEGLAVQVSDPAPGLDQAPDLALQAREDLEDRDLVPQVQEDLVEVDSGPALGQDLPVQDPAVAVLIHLEGLAVQASDRVLAQGEQALALQAREDLEDQDLVLQVQEDLVVVDSDPAPGQDLPVQDLGLLVQAADPVVVALEGALTPML